MISVYTYMNRRKFISVCGVGSLGALAGCIDNPVRGFEFDTQFVTVPKYILQQVDMEDPAYSKNTVTQEVTHLEETKDVEFVEKTTALDQKHEEEMVNIQFKVVPDITIADEQINPKIDLSVEEHFKDVYDIREIKVMNHTPEMSVNILGSDADLLKSATSIRFNDERTIDGNLIYAQVQRKDVSIIICGIYTIDELSDLNTVIRSAEYPGEADINTTDDDAEQNSSEQNNTTTTDD